MICGERFLTEDVLAGSNRQKRERRVQAVGSHIWNGVHSTFREQFHEVGERQVSKLQFSHGVFLPWRLIFGVAASGARGAILYTIIECCRRWGSNPFDYLRDVLTRLPDFTKWSVAEFTRENWHKSLAPSRLAAQSKFGFPIRILGPGKGSLLQTLCQQPQSRAIPVNDFEPCVAAMSFFTLFCHAEAIPVKVSQIMFNQTDSIS